VGLADSSEMGNFRNRQAVSPQFSNRLQFVFVQTKRQSASVGQFTAWARNILPALTADNHRDGASAYLESLSGKLNVAVVIEELEQFLNQSECKLGRPATAIVLSRRRRDHVIVIHAGPVRALASAATARIAVMAIMIQAHCFRNSLSILLVEYSMGPNTFPLENQLAIPARFNETIPSPASVRQDSPADRFDFLK
jgi:hypothetical protein